MANLIEYIQSQVYENSTEDISGSIMQQVLTRMASDEGVVNVHTITGQTPFADYNNAQAARDAVPAGFKKLGLIITYKLSSGWYVDEFIGSATSGWSTASNWKCLGPISVSQNASTGKTTITIGSQSFDVATQPVSVSQNIQTGHTDITVGSTTTPVASVEEVSQLGQELNINFGADYTNSLLLNKKIVIPANIGDITDITPQDQSGFNCICVPAKKMEVFKLMGRGGAGPRLWAVLDKDYRLVSAAVAHAYAVDYVFIAPIDGFVVYNSEIAEGNYFKSFGTFLQNTINVTVEYPLEAGQYYTLATAIAAIPIERRRACQTLIFMSGPNIVSMYSYNSISVDDVYWNQTSRWVKWLQDADINTIDEAVTILLSDKLKAQEYENGKVLTGNLISNKCYRIGSASIGDTISLTPDSQSGVACLLYECKDGDTFLVKGYGLSGPCLWGFLDTDAKLLSMCEVAYYQTPEEGIYLTAKKDGYLIINTQMDFANNLVKLLGHNPDNYIHKAKWLAMGDSITEGYYSYGDGQYAITHDCWANYVKFIKGYNLINYGTGAQGYAHGPSCARILVDALITQNALADVNLVTLAYGVNDWKYNETLGSMDDEVSASAVNIIPSMRYVIERLMAANPKMKIIVIMPINCSAYGTKENNYGIGYPFSNNGTLEQIYSAFKDVCDYYGIEYIDMLHSSVVNRENITGLLLDGVHPSVEGHKLMARELSMKINCY